MSPLSLSHKLGNEVFTSQIQSPSLIGLESAGYLGMSVSSQEKLMGGMKVKALSTSSRLHHKTAQL